MKSFIQTLAFCLILFAIVSCEKKEETPVELICDVTSTNVSVYGGNDGSITINVIKGNGDYRYKLNGIEKANNVINGLSAGTYSVYVTDKESKEFTISVTITQPLAAPTVETSVASVVSINDVTLNGKVNPNSSITTSLYFEYGTTIDYGTKVNLTNINGSSLTNVSTKITSGLIPNRTYHFRLVATNSSGTTNGNDMTFSITTQPTVTTSSIPTNYIGSTWVTFVGSVNPQNNILTNVYFKYGATTSYGKTIDISTEILNQINSLPTLPQNLQISLTDGSLTPKTLYHYKLVADYNGGTVEGNDMTFTTWAMSPSSTALAATNITSTTATLNGNVNPNGVTTTNLYFEYGTSTSYGTTVSLSNVSGTSNVTANINNLAINTTYHYRLVATNEGGTTTSNDMTFNTPSWKVGDEMFGGVVFYIDESNGKIYIVEKTNESDYITWTDANNLNITRNGATWRLPTWNEMKQVYTNVSNISNPNITPLIGWYWTSDNSTINVGEKIYFDTNWVNDNTTSAPKSYSKKLRLVTTFQ